MKRRSLFQLLVGAVAASAMEVLNWVPPSVPRGFRIISRPYCEYKWPSVLMDIDFDALSEMWQDRPPELYMPRFDLLDGKYIRLPAGHSQFTHFKFPTIEVPQSTEQAQPK